MIILHNILCSMKKKENYLQLPMGGTEHENCDMYRGIRPIDQRISVGISLTINSFVLFLSDACIFDVYNYTVVIFTISYLGSCIQNLALVDGHRKKELGK